jgi:hypothetical protein
MPCHPIRWSLIIPLYIAVLYYYKFLYYSSLHLSDNYLTVSLTLQFSKSTKLKTRNKGIKNISICTSQSLALCCTKVSLGLEELISGQLENLSVAIDCKSERLLTLFTSLSRFPLPQYSSNISLFLLWTERNDISILKFKFDHALLNPAFSFFLNYFPRFCRTFW